MAHWSKSFAVLLLGLVVWTPISIFWLAWNIVALPQTSHNLLVKWFGGAGDCLWAMLAAVTLLVLFFWTVIPLALGFVIHHPEMFPPHPN